MDIDELKTETSEQRESALPTTTQDVIMNPVKTNSSVFPHIR